MFAAVSVFGSMKQMEMDPCMDYAETKKLASCCIMYDGLKNGYKSCEPKDECLEYFEMKSDDKLDCCCMLYNDEKHPFDSCMMKEKKSEQMAQPN